MHPDIVIVGAGIAGASAAAMLSRQAKVVLLEREDQPGYHATGRSAAQFAESYGNAPVRALTAASRAFFENPPEGFCEAPLLSPRGALFIARADQLAALDAFYRELSADFPAIERLDAADARRIVTILRPDYLAGAVLDPASADIDVHALHQGFLRLFRQRGGILRLNSDVCSLRRKAGVWHIGLASGEVLQSPVIVNAGGAWAGEIARLAAASPIAMTPKRRSVALIAPPAGCAIDGWPLVVDADEEFYFKPDAGQVLISPADETPSPPTDARPEEWDIALAIDRVQRAADLPVRRINHSWAGLRTFSDDKTPVIGWDRQAEGFFWLAGQGGYGVQTAPAIAELTTTLIAGTALPATLRDYGIDPADTDPARFS